MNRISLFIILAVVLTACTAVASPPAPASVTPEPPPSATQASPALWVSSSVPAGLRDALQSWGIARTENPALATQKLDVASSGVMWIYVLAVPFPTLVDDVSSADLVDAWKGGSSGALSGHGLLMAESTLQAFTALWGEPASSAVRVVPSDQLLEEAWSDLSRWAILPFEEIQSRWKILSVDGQSPIRKNFEAESYPLKVTFGLTDPSAFALPQSNYDASQLTTVVMTGVTALVRATAFTMETKGITRPGELIYDWLHEADIAHISNEVPFDVDCPFPVAGHTNFILCSSPKYFELLKYVGTDVVELTGDHFADRGVQAMLDTLEIYRQNGLPYYGGGANATEARQPVLMEINGTKIAFMGCNGKRTYTFVKATDISPGAADCDNDYYTRLIQAATAQGYQVIFTFQHEECYHSGPCYAHEEDFRAVADAGAVVVSGSQAHYPHLMEFRGDTFIHYGLGNLFFDQMTYEMPDGSLIDETRREFLDRHVFYQGKYLGVELLTAMLEDYSRPRPMNEREREQFLSEYFSFSGWVPLLPTPIPQPTPTLTPIALP